MINTIFWFANDYNDYERERDGQGISDKTIVFVKETGEIYINNRKYGKTLQDIVNDPEMTDIFKDSALKEEIQQMIDQLEGKHDLDIETLESKHDYDIELLRGLINANKASQDQDKEELDHKIDTTKTDLTTEINNAITTTGTAVSDSESRLNQSITTLNNLINTNKTIADNAISNLQTSYNNLSGSVGTDIANALKDANGRTVWNRIDTADGNISAITNRINTSLDADGNIKNTSVLQGLIRTYSKTYDDSGLQAAVAELGTKWALLDANERILKWLASGFTSETTQYATFAAMYAAGGSGNNQNVEPGQPYEPEGYAELKAKVEEINGAYLARTELGSLSRADLSTAFSGMATEAYADGIEERAVATITNKINNKEISAISGLYSAVGTAQSTADKALAQSALFASMNDSYDPNDETTWGISSATINWVNFDKAVSEVITQYKPNNGDSSSATAIKSISTVNSAGESLDTIVNNAVDLKFANTSFATTSQLETVDGKATGAMTATTNLVNAVGELDPNTGQIKKDTQGNPVLLSSTSILSEARSAKNSADENSAKLDILATAYNFDFSDSGDKKTTWITNAGLLTSAGLGTAMASLIAQEESNGSTGNVDATKEPTVAQIIAAIKNHKSSLELSADDVNIITDNFKVKAENIILNGRTWADIINANKIISQIWKPGDDYPNNGVEIDNSKVYVYATDSGYTDVRSYSEITASGFEWEDWDANNSVKIGGIQNVVIDTDGDVNIDGDLYVADKSVLPEIYTTNINSQGNEGITISGETFFDSINSDSIYANTIDTKYITVRDNNNTAVNGISTTVPIPGYMVSTTINGVLYVAIYNSAGTDITSSVVNGGSVPEGSYTKRVDKILNINHGIITSVTDNIVNILYSGTNSGGGSIETTPVTGVSIAPNNVSITVGSTKQLNTTVTPSGATTNIVWSSNNESKVTVSQSGLITAKAITTSPVTITATASNGVSGTCTVNVIAAPDPKLTINVVTNDGTDISSQVIVYYQLNDEDEYNDYTGPVSIPAGTNVTYGAYYNGSDYNYDDDQTFTMGSSDVSKNINFYTEKVTVYVNKASDVTTTLPTNSFYVQGKSTRYPSGTTLKFAKGQQYNIKCVDVDGLVAPSSGTITATGDLNKQITLTYTKDTGVDLGLPSGIKWGRKNIGASSETDPGDGFCWGDPTVRDVMTYVDDSYNSTYYNSAAGHINGNITQGSSNDIATSILGSGWVTPSKANFDELVANTTQTTSGSGSSLRYVKFTGSNGNYIILPNPDYNTNVGTKAWYQTTTQYVANHYTADYWSGSSYAFGYDSSSNTFRTDLGAIKHWAYPIRPIRLS